MTVNIRKYAREAINNILVLNLPTFTGIINTGNDLDNFYYIK